MPRLTTKGQCVFCKHEFSKSGMTKHLETCKERKVVNSPRVGMCGYTG